MKGGGGRENPSKPAQRAVGYSQQPISLSGQCAEAVSRHAGRNCPNSYLHAVFSGASPACCFTAMSELANFSLLSVPVAPPPVTSFEGEVVHE